MHPEPLELQVADNGDGLSDVTKALVLFSSSKSGHGSLNPTGLFLLLCHTVELMIKPN